MVPADSVIAALIEAAPRLHDPAVRKAYERLLNEIEAHLNVPLFDEDDEPIDIAAELVDDGPPAPLSETQIVLLRHGLRTLESGRRGASSWLGLRRAMHALAEALAEPPRRETAHKVVNIENQRLVDRRTITHIDSVSGSTINIIGEQRVYPNPGSERAWPPHSPPMPADLDLEFGGGGGAAPPPEHDIFLSYSRRDASIMRRVKADLTASGFVVWTDEYLTPGTPSWLKIVEEKISQAACLLILMSPDSRQSNWVGKELTFATAHRVPIFPLLIRGDERSSVPLILSGYQYADVRKERAYRASFPALVRAVREVVSARDFRRDYEQDEG
ncbi:MAG: toll/interleukin-1 receptor domain-containing protein [Aggregatilineales bacterium]